MSAVLQFLLAILIFITLMSMCFIVPMYLINYNIILDFKSRRIQKRIQKYSADDPFWNHDEMMNLGRQMFIHIQESWHSGHFRHLAGSLSDRQKLEWNYLGKTMLKLGYRFIFTKVDIENVKIIGAVDHYDNDKDSFEIAISGSIKRYLQYRKNGRIVPGNSHEQRNFVDILIFRRINNKWLLDEMKTDARIFDVLKTKDKDYHKFVGEG